MRMSYFSFSQIERILMKKSPFLILLIVLTACIVITGKSQNSSFKISTERNSDESVSFNFEKEDFGTYYVKLTFSHVENSSTTSYQQNVRGLNGTILTLKPLVQNKPIGYSYKYIWIRGKLNPKIDTDFVYLLPVSRLKTSLVIENSNLKSSYFNGTQPRNWKAYQFKVDSGDTVFAARKGIVVDLIDGNAPDSSSTFVYKSSSNSVLIEHEDGTLAHYDVLRNGSFMVNPGDKVLPHTPLGLAGTFDTGENSQIRFYVYYLCEDNLETPDKETMASKKNYYAFVNPVFYTNAGNVHLKTANEYTADYSSEHIQKELSKREKKKLGW